MSVVATSVFLLFALIVLGFILGKRNIIHKESIPDFSTLVLKVTMPVTVFCSIIDQDRSQLFAYGIQTFVTIILLHVCAFLIGLLLVKVMKVADLDQGVWIYCMLFSNNGFMGIPLALSIFGGKGMFLMALGNVVSNFLIFSVGIKLLTYYKLNVHACSRTVSFQTSGQSCFPGSQDDPFDIDQADSISVADSGTVTDRSGCTG